MEIAQSLISNLKSLFPSHGVTEIVTVADAPAANEGQLQVTTPLACVQVPPPVGVAELKVTPAGRVSVATTLEAATVPLLRTVRV